ncbi:hypothetical protein HanPSC8_Chr13g0571081 [Helianthus annuus]|nr:hypothetical protein HanPSC8_Chr13g0571081 [Helianthus annuus]
MELPSKAMLERRSGTFLAQRSEVSERDSTQSSGWVRLLEGSRTDKVIMSGTQKLELRRRWCSMLLDDWVLCRIYKKNSSTEKMTSSSPTTELSHQLSGQLSSSSNGLDSYGRTTSFLNLSNRRTKYQKSDIQNQFEKRRWMRCRLHSLYPNLYQQHTTTPTGA